MMDISLTVSATVALGNRRTRRKIMTDRMVAALPRKARRYTRVDPEMRGHYLRVPSVGPTMFYAVAHDLSGRLVWSKIGPATLLTIAESRELARVILKRVDEVNAWIATRPSSRPKREDAR